jgi:hypothetical protein
VLFEKRLQRGLTDGSISLAFRRWRRSQVVAGRQYRSPVGMVDVTDVSVVADGISDEDARRAGFSSAKALYTDLQQGEPDGQIFRIELHLSQAPDPRSVLAADATLSPTELADLQKRLQRLDRDRTWTTETLEAIAAEPGRRAGDLAPRLGWSELRDFKLHVRQLKALGLTISLPVGYRLSPRGEAYLHAIKR